MLDFFLLLLDRFDQHRDDLCVSNPFHSIRPFAYDIRENFFDLLRNKAIMKAIGRLVLGKLRITFRINRSGYARYTMNILRI